jgi:hypothetical protein
MDICASWRGEGATIAVTRVSAIGSIKPILANIKFLTRAERVLTWRDTGKSGAWSQARLFAESACIMMLNAAIALPSDKFVP